jgi:hypothetical protein
MKKVLVICFNLVFNFSVAQEAVTFTRQELQESLNDVTKRCQALNLDGVDLYDTVWKQKLLLRYAEGRSFCCSFVFDKVQQKYYDEKDEQGVQRIEGLKRRLSKKDPNILGHIDCLYSEYKALWRKLKSEGSCFLSEDQVQECFVSALDPSYRVSYLQSLLRKHPRFDINEVIEPPKKRFSTFQPFTLLTRAVERCHQYTGPVEEGYLYTMKNTDTQEKRDERLKKVKVLLTAGANPNVGMCSDKTTLLQRAVKNEDVELVKILLQGNADPQNVIIRKIISIRNEQFPGILDFSEPYRYRTMEESEWFHVCGRDCRRPQQGNEEYNRKKRERSSYGCSFDEERFKYLLDLKCEKNGQPKEGFEKVVVIKELLDEAK